MEFFTDFVRQQSDSWLESFVQRQHRKQARLDWVQDRINRNQYYEIADYARDRSERRMVVHVVADGLQGKLLEGLVQLSSGEKEGSGARYLAELVRLHQSSAMDPSRYGPGTKSPLGRDIVELVEKAPAGLLGKFQEVCFCLPGAGGYCRCGNSRYTEHLGPEPAHHQDRPWGSWSFRHRDP